MAPSALLATWLLSGIALGACATALARTYALRRRLLDLPGERRSHRAATPRGGGISIVLVLLVALACLAAAHPTAALTCLLAGAGLLLVAGIGWVDDHRPLPAWPRLAVHGVAAVLLALAVWRQGGAPADLALAFLAAVVLVNVWNFMDGIDGIAAGQALVVVLAWALLAGQGPVLWAGLALAAGLLGFLPFNVPRARIFLGDVGSGAIGYALAALLAFGTVGRPPELRVLWVFPLLPFLLDASLTLLTRMVAGEAWWRPHVQHAYQAWARALGSHLPVTLSYGAAAAVAAAVMFVVRSGSSALIMSTCLTFLLAGGLAWKRLRGLHAGNTTDSLTDGKR
ncbi:lipopolysaccharide biosynthesis protein [Luteimonas kalidii]|uniref:Lipopolysaccharide biosynthesis protein n=1 Tax=Luteimonas kalidii TaxID=3042025 RepID=A0ABT6JSG6_9GAMM|nr:lipopolysaccharide biosynthesis protein [Luteimonas kalidii]MDH5833629.1 lipopolysaccharide biosynthesis protein [Luteimonas kalidii]